MRRFLDFSFIMLLVTHLRMTCDEFQYIVILCDELWCIVSFLYMCGYFRGSPFTEAAKTGSLKRKGWTSCSPVTTNSWRHIG
jgi:hypothetical protein